MRFTTHRVLLGWLSIITILLVCRCEKKMTGADQIPVSLEIRTPSSTTYSGGFIQQEAFAEFENGTEQDVTVNAEWTIFPGSSGLVAPSGLFTAFSSSTGSETIMADYQGQSDSLSIAITVRASSFAIWPTSVALESGGELQFQASASYRDASGEFVTDLADWTVKPGTAGEIDAQGLFQAYPGMTGQETISGHYHGLVDSAQVLIGSTEPPVEMVTIPAGSYWMGDDQGWSNEKPLHQVYIDAFEIGLYEVTNTQYVKYLNAALAKGDIYISSGIVSGSRGPYSGMIYFRYNASPEFPDRFIDFTFNGEAYLFAVLPGYNNHPVVRMTWYGAAAFCAFYGLRLPTEAEWEKACRGGQQLAYGTVDGSMDHDMANYLGTGRGDVYEGSAPVGSFPANPYGLFDMCGNDSEYVFDAYDTRYYDHSPSSNPTGQGPVMFTGRIQDEANLFRGGSWNSYMFYCRSAYRGAIEDQPDHNLLSQCHIGFRVARSID